MAEHKVDIYMPLYVRDFLTSTFGWSAEERGHYLVLLMIAWDRGGLPEDLGQLERLSPGVSGVWHLLADKFPVSDDGQRRNGRLEKHRDRCVELKEKRVEAAKRAAAAKAAAAAARAAAEQTQSNRGANAEQALSNRGANVNHPTSTSTSTPTSTSSLREEIKHYTHTPGGEPREAGWAEDEWQRFLAKWAVTERAAPWPGFMAPDGWVQNASYPSWLGKAHHALERLPRCQFFDQPLAITRFFEYVDRILAGEFDNPKKDRTRARQPVGGNL